MSKITKFQHGVFVQHNQSFELLDRGFHGIQVPPLELPHGAEYYRGGYRAIVFLGFYSLKNIDSVTATIRTPAHQLIWTEKILKWDSIFKVSENNTTLSVEQKQQYYVPQSWVDSFLSREVGHKFTDWDAYTRCNPGSEVLFFQRRKHAALFAHEVAKRLEGLKVTMR